MQDSGFFARVLDNGSLRPIGLHQASINMKIETKVSQGIWGYLRVSLKTKQQDTKRYPEIPVSQGIFWYLLEKNLRYRYLRVSLGILTNKNFKIPKDTLRYLEVPSWYFHTGLNQICSLLAGEVFTLLTLEPAVLVVAWRMKIRLCPTHLWLRRARRNCCLTTS